MNDFLQKYNKFIFGWITAFIIFYVLYFLFFTPIFMWQHQAVIHGAAHYNTITGDFQWNNPPTNLPPL